MLHGHRVAQDLLERWSRAIAWRALDQEAVVVGSVGDAVVSVAESAMAGAIGREEKDLVVVLLLMMTKSRMSLYECWQDYWDV